MRALETICFGGLVEKLFSRLYVLTFADCKKNVRKLKENFNNNKEHRDFCNKAKRAEVAKSVL